MEAFGRVLRVPHVRWLMGTAVVARLPYGIVGLATLLFVHDETGSFAIAGAVAAAGQIAAGVSLPVLGRLIDAIGQTRVLVASALVQAAGGAALIALVLAGASTAVLCLVAAVAGAATPPVSPALRGLWPDVLGDDPLRLRSALALDAISLEAAFVGGPLLTAGLVTGVSPAAALAAGYAISVSGSLAFASSVPSRRWRGSGTASFGLGPLRSPGLLVLIASSLPLGFAFGAIEVALPAFGVGERSAAAGALAIAALAVGSAACGLIYGARPPRRLVRTYVLLCAALPVGIALLAIPSSLLVMLLLAPLAGAVVAPLTAAENELAGRVAPDGTVTEAYAWVITATVGGLAAGTAVAGAVVEAAGWREAVLVGALVAATGAVVAVAGRGTLHPHT